MVNSACTFFTSIPTGNNCVSMYMNKIQKKIFQFPIFFSFQTDHDPRNPSYIVTQGPLGQTVSDFWQMVWEQGCVVIVMLSRYVN